MKTITSLVVMMLVMSSTVFGQTIDVEKLANAIYLAEGGSRAVKPYGILKDYCKKGDPDGQCRKGCIQTINKRYKMWDKQGDFISYLSKSYCPIGAENDPKGLNKNWVKNVSHFYNKEV
mgnify:CR=1 FL=1